LLIVFGNRSSHFDVIAYDIACSICQVKNAANEYEKYSFAAFLVMAKSSMMNIFS